MKNRKEKDMELELQIAENLKKTWFGGQESFELMTSGSTGKPKKIVINRSEIIKSAKLTAQTFGLKKGDHLFCCLSPLHVAGFMMVMRALVLETQLTIVQPSSHPLRALPEDIQIDFAAFVPIQLIELNEKEINILNKMKSIIVGGGEVMPNLFKTIKSIKTPVYQTYGMTETLTHIAIRQLNSDKTEEFFTPLKGVKTSIDNRNCLIINTPVNGKKTIVSNDLVELNKDGTFKWIGRYDNVIISGAFKLHPEKTEHEITKLLKVHFKNFNSNLLLIPVPDKLLGQKAVLLIETANPKINLGKFKEEILKLCKINLHPYCVPKDIVFIEHIKQTISGKPDRLSMIEDTVKLYDKLK